jgi:serine/threonine protein kinase
MNNLCKNFIEKICFFGVSPTTVKYPTICDGRYTLEKRLQSGYSGQVFQGHFKNKIPVVVKCCKKYSSWKVETFALQQLKHKNIIKLVGIPKPNVKPNVKSNNLINISIVHVLGQEFATYGDLYDLLQKHGYFSEKWTRTFFVSILNGLVYAYEKRGISHRDIKLENILISGDGIIKIGDWGLAAFNVKNNRFHTSCGTIGYMSPEMICEQKYDSNKTDVWALGVLLFSLCTQVRPYTEPKKRYKNNKWMDQWLLAIVNGNWGLWWKYHFQSTPHIQNLSFELCDLIEKMFCGNEEERVSLSEILNHDWVQQDVYSNKEIIELCKQYQD